MTSLRWRLSSLFGSGGSFRTLIVVFCTGLAALMWVGLAYQVSYERDRAVERREAENDNLARLFEEHVLRTLAAASVTLKQLATEYRLHGERLDLAQYLRDRQPELEPYTVLSVVDAEGNLVLATMPFTKPQNFRLLENAQFHMRNASEHLFIAKPRSGTVSGRLTIYLTRRMNKPDGSFGGNTGVGMDPQYLSRFYEQIDLGPDSVVSLVGRDGVIRARQSNARAASAEAGQDMNNSPLFTTYLRQHERGRFRGRSPVDGVTRLYSYRSVKAYPLVVLVGTSEDATLAGFEQRKRAYVSWASAASIVIFAFAAWALFQLSRQSRTGEKLRESEARYRTLFEQSPDGIVLADGAGRIVMANRHLEDLFGYRRGELPGRSIDMLVPERFRQAHARHRESYQAAPLVRQVGTGRALFARRKDGTDFPVEIGLSPLHTSAGTLIIGIVRDVTERRRAEEKISAFMKRMRALSERIVAVQEEERRALAHELHDEIGQSLTAVKIHLQALEQAFEREVSVSTESLHEALLAVTRTLEQVRSLSLDLRPMQLDDLGLSVALRALLARDAAAAGWEAHFEEDSGPGRLASALELACYRVAQEALTNIMRHADATEVWVTLQKSDRVLQLTVRDNGSGFDVASARSTTDKPHLGLLGMEERVGNAAGRLEIRATPREGTEVSAIFPIAAEGGQTIPGPVARA
jgi:PAS domain S-box-containing protein